MAIQKYLNLITSEHQNKPKFNAWLSAALNKVDDGITAANSIPTAFDIDTAVGVQLDILGQAIGQLRDIGVPLTSASSILDDDHYRLVLKAKIARNQWDGTIGQIYDIWNGAFPNSALQIIDNQDMSMQAVVTNLTDNLSTELVTAGLIIPKPMGVTLIIIADTTISEELYFGAIVSGGDITTITTQNPA
ncbi:DUF2612 domain-containing protein [Alicyclobacillus suci]|uniref:DUF2612 domain-containing protein n=1 Tax=Alicyclobacillus suci TaxID=2816080 RepID=UPI001A9058F2|nr:DUF2612 domain-containing protein [Alicyclobacillus suci]